VPVGRRRKQKKAIAKEDLKEEASTRGNETNEL
jgi:hypothetical protein